MVGKEGRPNCNLNLISGCSSVWLERLIWVQEAGGSSPFIRTSQQHTAAWRLDNTKYYIIYCGNSSMVESQISNLVVAGSSPVYRSNRHIQQIILLKNNCRFESCKSRLAFWRNWFIRV